MFTKRLIFVLTLSAIFVIVPWIANAGPVTITFIDVNGMNDGSYFVDPYFGQINNGPVIEIWCVDFAHPVNDNQWTADATWITDSSTNFGSTYLGNKTDYLAIVWLINQYQDLLNTPSTTTFEQLLEYQYAIWSFSGWSTTDTTMMTKVGDVRGNALGAVARGYNPSGWTILTDTQGSNQEFIVEETVPEPSLMVLMLIGLAAVCVYCYRAGRN